MFQLLAASLLIGAAAAELADIADVSLASGGDPAVRNPKLFYVSSTTATVSTSTLCFIKGNTLVACSKRKRRRAVTFDSLDKEGVTRVLAGR